MFCLCDALRIDHFRGLESFYAIPYGDDTAKGGQWKPGPGAGFIDAVRAELPDAPIIAEDLGFLTDGVRELLAYSGYPGMKLLQFAFDTREAGDYSPYSYGANTVVYTGTHDNDTMEGWGDTAPRDSVRQAMEYMGIGRKSRLAYGMIRLAMQTAANLAVIPMQDWLRLGSGARMNTPSTVGGLNWRWRVEKAALTGRLAETMARMAALYGRGA
jgi:4-alpha-glucanotransferase